MKPEAIERLKQLEDRGVLTTEAVLLDAENPDSPLHELFDWDDASAAKSWRTEQARRLIRSVKLVIENRDIVIRSVAYVRDPDTPSGYNSVLTLRNDHDKARRALIMEFDRAYAAMTRAYDVAAGLGITDEIDEIRARIMGIKDAV